MWHGFCLSLFQHQRALIRREPEALSESSRGMRRALLQRAPNPFPRDVLGTVPAREPSSRGHRVVVLLTARCSNGSRTTRERV